MSQEPKADDLEFIAERVIYAVDADSRGFDIGLQIGKPYETESGGWNCKVALIGYFGPRDITGVDSWQALMLGRRLLLSLLTYFEETGGKLFWERDGAEVMAEGLFEGIRPQRPEDLVVMTDEEYQRNIDSLTVEELQVIDDALLAAASNRFRKVAFVVGTAMTVNKEIGKQIPDLFYASRVRKLVDEGRLWSEGNLDHMRYSEVRLPE